MGSNINERITLIRKELGLTMEEMATRLGENHSALCAIESDYTKPSAQLIHSLCREFHVNPAYLEEGTGNMFLEITPQLTMTEFMAKAIKNPESFKSSLLMLIASWSDEEWKWFENQVKILASSLQD